MPVFFILGITEFLSIITSASNDDFPFFSKNRINEPTIMHLLKLPFILHSSTDLIDPLVNISSELMSTQYYWYYISYVYTLYIHRYQGWIQDL